MGATAEKMADLEKECIEINAQHQSWETTEERMKLTKGGNALYMHCLPADITGVSCEHGEVSANVFEKYRVEMYKEAENKLYIIAALILSQRFPHPAEIIEEIVKRNAPVNGIISKKG